MRKLGFLVALAIVGALLGIAPAAAQPTPEVTAFCEAALTTDKASEKVFVERPKQKDLQAFQAGIAQMESTAPPEVATSVQAAAASIRTAFQERKDPFDDPTLGQNISAIDEYRYNSCGYAQVDVTGVEYEFQGLPRTLPAGPVAIRFTDTGAELHELAIYRVKSKDSVRKIAGFSEKDLAKKTVEIGRTEAAQGQTSYTIAELSRSGRYVVICHFPVGSTSEEAVEEAEGEHDAKSHAQEGMIQEIKVEGSSTTTT